MGYEIDFLPVGDGEKSGDAITLRFGNLFGERHEQTVVVIDGGFQSSGEALVNHVSRYYNTSEIDVVISTHPDADHASGLGVVLEKLTVRSLWMHQPWNHTDDIARLFKDGRITDSGVREKLRRSLEHARNLEDLANSKGIPIIEPFQGRIDESGCLRVLGPTTSYYESLLPDFRSTPEAIAAGRLRQMIEKAGQVITKIVESFNIETLTDGGETSAENNSSVILLLTVDGRSILFTADAGIPALNIAADFLENEDFNYSSLSCIQVPHHGSKRNVGPTVLNRLIGERQQLEYRRMNAVVSVSENGAPKHPAKKVTNAFKRRGAPVFSTSGKTILQHHEAPIRGGWSAVEPLPLYIEVDE